MTIRIAPGPVEEDMRFQEREWRIKRMAWAAFAVTVLAALGGLFSRGPLSETQASSADGRFVVEYARFERDGASSQLIVHAAAEDGQAAIVLDRRFAEVFSIESIEPRPAQAHSLHGGMHYVFTSRSPQAVVRFAITPNNAGFVTSTVGDGRNAVVIRQLIYP